MFGNIHSLSLVECNELYSLNGLGKKIVSVHLDNLINVQDFTPIKDVKKVKISNCSKISVAFQLSSVQFLTIKFLLSKTFTD
jgi:hypothetical protein